ncbi:hypothetical protein V8E53_010959 [Lactarius tabidus]
MGTAQSRIKHALSRATPPRSRTTPPQSCITPSQSRVIPPQGRPQIQKIRFRVLVIGRANAGKTSILQRVCETTESPTIYRGNNEVTLNPSMDRGEHRIDDELVFSNHTGYVFHDSQGIEAGDEEKLEILKDFIQRKCGERRLQDRLHAIWYCVPMDDHRPGLNLRFYENVCPDQNVPVIAVFTKYDQFRRNVEIDVSDDPNRYLDSNVSQVAEERFQEHYLRPLGDDVKYVRLEKMHRKDSHCDSLVETTAAALNEETVALMLLAVQRRNLEFSVKAALRRVHKKAGLNARLNVKEVIQECLVLFPYIWASPADNACPWLSRMWVAFVSGCGVLLCFWPADNACHWLSTVVLFLKHATLLRISNKADAALAQVDLDYQKANINLKIQEHLKAYSSQDSVEKFAGFIMATDIGEFVLLFVTTISHQAFSTISVFSHSWHIEKIFI